MGAHGPTQLADLLADRVVSLRAAISPYRDEMGGEASTADLESLFQLVHLSMAEPRYDEVVLGQFQRSVAPVVANPAVDPGAAGIDALIDARYGGEVRYTAVPTPEEFATLDLAGIQRVWEGRFGNAGDWVFAFAGDFDPDQLRQLAARYIATLPGTPGAEVPVDLGAPPPPGVTELTVEAGTGDTASTRLLFTTPASDPNAGLQVLADLSQRVLSARLIDVVREELGESYSPRAQIQLVRDPDAFVQTYVEVTGAPDRMTIVGDVVIDELADLVAEGPDDDEFDRAIAEVSETYDFLHNQDLLNATIEPLLDPEVPARSPLERTVLVTDFTADDVQDFLAQYLPVDQHIRVVVLPTP